MQHDKEPCSGCAAQGAHLLRQGAGCSTHSEGSRQTSRIASSSACAGGAWVPRRARRRCSRTTRAAFFSVGLLITWFTAAHGQHTGAIGWATMTGATSQQAAPRGRLLLMLAERQRHHALYLGKLSACRMRPCCLQQHPPDCSTQGQLKA